MAKEKTCYIKWNIKLSNIAKTGTNFKITNIRIFRVITFSITKSTTHIFEIEIVFKWRKVKWDKVCKNGPSEIFGRQPLKHLM